MQATDPTPRSLRTFYGVIAAAILCGLFIGGLLMQRISVPPEYAWMMLMVLLGFTLLTCVALVMAGRLFPRASIAIPAVLVTILGALIAWTGTHGAQVDFLLMVAAIGVVVSALLTLTGLPFRQGLSAITGGMVTLLLVMLPIRVQTNPPSSGALSKTKQVALGVMMYAADHDDRTPHSAWMDSLGDYVKADGVFYLGPFADPVDKDATFMAMRTGIRDQPLGKINAPQESPMLFASEAVWRNQMDEMASLRRKGLRHGRNPIAYADGHAKNVKAPN